MKSRLGKFLVIKKPNRRITAKMMIEILLGEEDNDN